MIFSIWLRVNKLLNLVSLSLSLSRAAAIESAVDIEFSGRVTRAGPLWAANQPVVKSTMVFSRWRFSLNARRAVVAESTTCDACKIRSFDEHRGRYHHERALRHGQRINRRCIGIRSIPLIYLFATLRASPKRSPSSRIIRSHICLINVK